MHFIGYLTNQMFGVRILMQMLSVRIRMQMPGQMSRLHLNEHSYAFAFVNKPDIHHTMFIDSNYFVIG